MPGSTKRVYAGPQKCALGRDRHARNVRSCVPSASVQTVCQVRNKESELPKVTAASQEISGHRTKRPKMRPKSVQTLGNIGAAPGQDEQELNRRFAHAGSIARSWMVLNLSRICFKSFDLRKLTVLRKRIAKQSQSMFVRITYRFWWLVTVG